MQYNYDNNNNKIKDTKTFSPPIFPFFLFFFSSSLRTPSLSLVVASWAPGGKRAPSLAELSLITQLP
jgi:hypothetical protein